MRVKCQSCCTRCSKNGTYSVPANVPPGCGTNRLKNGTSRRKRDGWQPYPKVNFYRLDAIPVTWLTVLKHCTSLKQTHWHCCYKCSPQFSKGLKIKKCLYNMKFLFTCSTYTHTHQLMHQTIQHNMKILSECNDPENISKYILFILTQINDITAHAYLSRDKLSASSSFTHSMFLFQPVTKNSNNVRWNARRTNNHKSLH